MYIGDRLKYFRKLNKMTQKEVGLKLGFNEKNASIRVFQYETGRRIPKSTTLQRYADIFGVSVHTLVNTDVDDEIALIHTLFLLEDVRDMDLECDEKEVYFHLNNGKDNTTLFRHISAWKEMKTKYEKGDITKEEYDRWKNSYSDMET